MAVGEWWVEGYHMKISALSKGLYGSCVNEKNIKLGPYLEGCYR